LRYSNRDKIASILVNRHPRLTLTQKRLQMKQKKMTSQKV